MVNLRQSEVKKYSEHNYLYVLLHLAVDIHTNKKHPIHTLTEGTKLPRIFFPLAAASFQIPCTPPRMWVCKCPSVSNVLYNFLCTMYNDPKWDTSTNKRPSTVLSCSYFSIIDTCICRYSDTYHFNVVTVTHCLKSQYIPSSLWLPIKINFSFIWALWTINCIFSHWTAHKTS